MMFAAAQKRYLYIYDHTGMELHCLKKHNHVNKLTFLPYHFLLVSAVRSFRHTYHYKCCIPRTPPSPWSYRLLPLGLIASFPLVLSPPSPWSYHSLQDDYGNLSYLDTSIGNPVTEHRTRMGSLKSMTHNPHNAIIHLGHQNGAYILSGKSVRMYVLYLGGHAIERFRCHSPVRGQFITSL